MGSKTKELDTKLREILSRDGMIDSSKVATLRDMAGSLTALDIDIYEYFLARIEAGEIAFSCNEPIGHVYNGIMFTHLAHVGKAMAKKRLPDSRGTAFVHRGDVVRQAFDEDNEGEMAPVMLWSAMAGVATGKVMGDYDSHDALALFCTTRIDITSGFDVRQGATVTGEITVLCVMEGRAMEVLIPFRDVYHGKPTFGSVVFDPRLDLSVGDSDSRVFARVLLEINHKLVGGA